MLRDYAILRRARTRQGGSLNGRRSDQRGDIIASWLFQVVAFLAVLGFVAYEIISIGVTMVALDDNAREVARAARDAYRAELSLDQAEDAAEAVAEQHQAAIVGLEEDDGELTVTLQKQAPTLLVHRIGPLEDLTLATQTTSIRVHP